MAEIGVIQQKQQVQPIGIVRSDQRTLGRGFDQIAAGADQVRATALQSEAVAVEEAGKHAGGAFIAKGPTGELIAPEFDAKTVYGRAAQNAALTTYFAQMDTDVSGKAAKMSADLMNDPMGPGKFQDQWNGITQGAVEGAPKELQGHVAAVYGRGGQQTFNGLLTARTQADYRQRGESMSKSEARYSDELQQLADLGKLQVGEDGSLTGDPAVAVAAGARKAMHDGLVGERHTTAENVAEADQRFMRDLRTRQNNFAIVKEFRDTIEPLINSNNSEGAYAKLIETTARIRKDDKLSLPEKDKIEAQLSEKFAKTFGITVSVRAEKERVASNDLTGQLLALGHQEDLAKLKAVAGGGLDDLYAVAAKKAALQSASLDGRYRIFRETSSTLDALRSFEAQRLAAESAAAQTAGTEDAARAAQRNRINAELAKAGLPSQPTPQPDRPTAGRVADPTVVTKAQDALAGTVTVTGRHQGSTTGRIEAPAPAGADPNAPEDAGNGYSDPLLSGMSATDVAALKSHVEKNGRPWGEFVSNLDRNGKTADADRAILEQAESVFKVFSNDRKITRGIERLLAPDGGSEYANDPEAATLIMGILGSNPANDTPAMARLRATPGFDSAQLEAKVIARVGIPKQATDYFESSAKSNQASELEAAMKRWVGIHPDYRAATTGSATKFFEEFARRYQDGNPGQDLAAVASDARETIRRRGDARPAVEAAVGKDVRAQITKLGNIDTLMGMLYRDIPGLQKAGEAFGILPANSYGVPQVRDGFGGTGKTAISQRFQNGVYQRSLDLMQAETGLTSADAVKQASKELMAGGAFGMSAFGPQGSVGLVHKPLEATFNPAGGRGAVLETLGIVANEHYSVARDPVTGRAVRESMGSGDAKPFLTKLDQARTFGDVFGARPEFRWNAERGGREVWFGLDTMRDGNGNPRLFKDSEFALAYHRTARGLASNAQRGETAKMLMDTIGGPGGNYLTNKLGPDIAADWMATVTVPSREVLDAVGRGTFFRVDPVTGKAHMDMSASRRESEKALLATPDVVGDGNQIGITTTVPKARK